MDTFDRSGAAVARKRKVVVVVMGATGTGKTRLSLDLAGHFPAEVINSDKIQVYRGLNIVTNKVTDDELAAAPHHLLGFVDPDADFTAADFRRRAVHAVQSILDRGRLPIVAGGSNSYIQALVDGEFRYKYDCCFLWVDVEESVLNWFVSRRVDRMVEEGMVEEVREVFRPDGDYSRGIRRAIGVPEMDPFFREGASADDATRNRLLESAVEEIKANTRSLAARQREKIRWLASAGWDLHRLDATEAFKRHGAEADEAWERLVARRSVGIVRGFLCRTEGGDDGAGGDVAQCGGSAAAGGSGGAAADAGCRSAVVSNCSTDATLVAGVVLPAMATAVSFASATC